VDEGDALRDIEDIHRVLAGDKGAFRPLVERYADRVLAFCRSRRLEEEEAADISQEVFLRAFRSLRSFRIGESFPAWLIAIAANRVRTRGTKRGNDERKIAAIGAETGSGAAPDSSIEVEKKLEAEAIRASVAKLPGDQRNVVELYYFAELPVADVARILGLGEEAVKSRLFRARKKLRSLLGGDEGEQPSEAGGGNTR